jgi:hypothetical protein
MNKYYILSLVIGVLHKLYDDLYDNSLYDYFHIEQKDIAYLNEFLKCMFVLGYAVLSLNFVFFYVFFSAVNIILYLIKKSEYGPYEFSGFLSSFVLLPFLKWDSTENYQKDILCIVTLFVGCFLLEKICNRNKNTEYSYTKLVSRVSAFVATLLILGANFFFNFLSPSLVVIFLFNIGYLLTSCVFQYILLKCSPQATYQPSEEKIESGTDSVV